MNNSFTYTLLTLFLLNALPNTTYSKGTKSGVTPANEIANNLEVKKILNSLDVCDKSVATRLLVNPKQHELCVELEKCSEAELQAEMKLTQNPPELSINDIMFINGQIYIKGAAFTDEEAQLIFNIDVNKYRNTDVYRADIEVKKEQQIKKETSTAALTDKTEGALHINGILINNNAPVVYSNPSKTDKVAVVMPKVNKILMTDIYQEEIPAHAHYDNIWSNSVLHPYHYDLTQMPVAVEFLLSNGIDRDFVMPINNVVTSEFGPRWGRAHNGIDLELNTGDAVGAAFDGKVRIAQYSKSYGFVVVIRHFNGLETYYAHLSKLLVTPNQNIKAGTIIALGGSTGHSTGSHLHFEIRYKGHPLNPREFIDFNTKTLKNHTFTIDRTYFTSTNPYQDLDEDNNTPNSYNHHNHNNENTIPANTSSMVIVEDNGREYHISKQGDNLTTLSEMYDISVNTICKLNGLSKRSTLRSGQKVRIK